jgi:signal transduction histidine kinase
MVLPGDRNRLELRFAALSFRDPGRIHYQVRLSPDESWADTDGQPFFNWVDLPPGRHQPEVRASLDGLRWSPVPAGVAFRVLPPWYRTGWAMSAFVLLGAALLFAIYRARIAYLLGLERQRTRIALDLHDEMGSGLASIGILASDVLSSNSGGGDEIAREVAATAEELGTALSDIVWSLDPQSATLDVLAARMAENGSRLFADDVELDTSFPEHWPPDPLPLPVLRNVLLIGLEALHNAARHAEAGDVTLSLQPEGAAWLLTVSDDGIGMTENAAPRGSGRGLRGMRRRADEIGGEIRWRTRAPSGTEVRLRFGPRGLARSASSDWPAAAGHRCRRAHPHEHAGAPAARPVHR